MPKTDLFFDIIILLRLSPPLYPQTRLDCSDLRHKPIQRMLQYLPNHTRCRRLGIAFGFKTRRSTRSHSGHNSESGWTGREPNNQNYKDINPSQKVCKNVMAKHWRRASPISGKGLTVRLNRGQQASLSVRVPRRRLNCPESVKYRENLMGLEAQPSYPLKSDYDRLLPGFTRRATSIAGTKHCAAGARAS